MIVDYEHPDVVIIHDGKISFFIPQYSLRITTKVKQTKGEGTYDAIYLKGKKISEKYHRPLLEMLLKRDERYPRSWFKSEDVCNQLRIDFHLKDPKYKFIENNWRRPISEFLALGILTHPQGNEQLYKLEVETAKRTLENGKFDQ